MIFSSRSRPRSDRSTHCLAWKPIESSHAQFEGGHMPLDIHDVMREMLDWFDRFLGPVNAVPH